MDTQKLNVRDLPEHEEMVRNLLVWYALATANKPLYEEGKVWYPKANNDCLELFQRYDGAIDGLTHRSTIKVIAAISPSTFWAQNVLYGEYVLDAYLMSDYLVDRLAYLSQFNVSMPYGYSNYDKAWKIIAGMADLEFKTGPKTFCFDDNIAHPYTSLRGTVDQHIAHMAIDDKSRGSLGISVSTYKRLERALVDAAKIAGLRTLEFQAIIWHTRVKLFESGHNVDSIYSMINDLA